MRGTWLLMRRAINEVIRVPGAAIPGIAAPTLFLLGLTAVFGKLTLLPGFSTSDFMAFILPISVMQSATFAGAATGVNLARDIEQGWFDRLYVSPLPRRSLLAGHVFSASLRSLMPISVVIVIGVAFGVGIQGVDALLLAIALAAAFAATVACFAIILALHFRTQQAAPLMQAGAFMMVLFTTAYAPLDLLTGLVPGGRALQPGALHRRGRPPDVGLRRRLGTHVEGDRGTGPARRAVRDAGDARPA